MERIENQTFDMERALYGSHEISVKNCSFDGPADGESALKESSDINVEHCFCNLRYPFWHDHRHSDHIEITGTKLHGIKALRECSDIIMKDCHIVSPEFGWSVKNLKMEDCSAESEYFMMRSQNLQFCRLKMTGKYSFQYIEDAVFEDCELDTKDAFWHAKNVLVKNSVVKGEYLAWYSDGLTLENCKIIGTQPLCYCKNLKLINCEMVDTDLSFEKSQVDAVITTPVISIKNPLSGCIQVPEVGEIIRDDENSKCEIILTK